jgi:RimJ/RimL family protein N-acetyltransferase
MAEDVRLRDVADSDLETFYAYEIDPEATRRSRFPPREHDVFLAHWETNVLGEPGIFVQTVTVDGKNAGSVVAWWRGGRRYLGYWLGRAYWGRGIGTEALRQFLDREPNRPLYADPYAGNTGSVRLLEKFGFQRAGSVWDGPDEHVLLVLEDRPDVAGAKNNAAQLG